MKHAPTRLVELEGPAADCIRDALKAESDPELPRFSRLSERRNRRAQRRGFGLIVAALALISLPVLRALEREPATASIRAEPEPARERALPAAPLPAQPVAAPALAVPPPAPAPRSKATPARPRLQPSADTAPSPAPAAWTELSPSARSCAELARGGAPKRALDCYRELAGGSGVTAELSLFEQARLEGKVLHDPARALSTLAEHRRRFPQGSLRPEVMLAQIEWLLAAGEEARALAVIEEALASESLRERTAELERLRSRLRAR